MPRHLALIILLLCSHAYAENAYVAGALGELFPGAGYMYLGQTQKAALSSSLVAPLAAPYYIPVTSTRDKSILINTFYAASNLYNYTVYDSFQMGLDLSGRPTQVVNIPHYELKDLLKAPFQASHYSTWKTYAPLGIAAAAMGFIIGRHGISQNLTTAHALKAIPLIFLQSVLVGVGEESQFRGFQYPAFSQLTGSAIWGNVLQSVSFGLCHTRLGVCTSPYGTGQIFIATETVDTRQVYLDSRLSPGIDTSYFIDTALFGLYTGWVSSSEKDGLLLTITMHAAFDSLGILTDLLSKGDTGRLYLSVSLPF